MPHRFFRNIPYYIAGLIVLFFSWAYWVNIPSVDRPYFDDAFMYMRYVHNIVDGIGCAWNLDGIPTYGCTDIVYTYLLVLIKLLFPHSHDETVLLYLPAAIGFLGLILITYTAYEVAQSKHLKQYKVIFTLIPLCLIPFHYFHFHAVSGMDALISFTTNSLFLLIFYKLLRKSTNSLAVLAAFAAYLTYLVRPDNGVYVLLFPALFFLVELPDRTKIIRFYASLGMLITMDILIKTYYFGTPLPLPFFAKKMGFQDGYLGIATWNEMKYVLQFLAYSSPLLFAIILTYTKQVRNQLLVLLLPVYCMVMYSFSMTQLMGHDARFYIPAIPFVVIAAIISVDHYFTVNNKLDLKRLSPRLAIVVGLFLAHIFLSDKIASAYSNTFLEHVKSYTFTDTYTTDKQIPAELNWWFGTLALTDICNNLPNGSTIAASEHGYLAAKSPNTNIIDLIALHNKELALHGFSMDYILGEKPSIIWLAHYNYTGINYSIVTNKQFQQDYYFIPQVFNYGIAIRKSDTDAYRAVQDEIKVLYGIDNIRPYIASFNS